MSTGLSSLAALVRDTQASNVARSALLVRLDQLPPPLRRPHHRRLARDALDPLLDADRACLHELPDGRLAVSWRGEAAISLRRVMSSLGYLLQDAPGDTPPLTALTRIFKLPQDGGALLAAAVEGTAPPLPAPAPPGGMVPLDAASLAGLEASLAGTDVARFARRAPVCAMPKEGWPARLALAWETRVLDVAGICAELAPGRDAEADAWLYRRLTRTLDRRLMALLGAPGELDGAGPFGLRLNVGSVLAPEFLRFDEALPPRLRGSVVLGFTVADVLADPAGFVFARDFARARQYRVLLREVTATLLPVLKLAQFEVDHVQLAWSPGLALAGLPARAVFGSAQIVLSGADASLALRWARVAGIGLVEGRAALPSL